jgi:hypothetical protein
MDENLTAILCSSPENQPYLALVYKLIFYTYKHNSRPEIACELLSGLIQFGQSQAGAPYKPMLDYFAIEAFNGLLQMRGWTILKPCVNTLKETLLNYKSEPLFKHIVACIVKQLRQDVNDMPYSSDLCYHLPHEKSYVLGWFSYIIASTYYDGKPKLTAKQLRKYMMFYRKLLIRLRKNVVEYVIYLKPETKNIAEKWESILEALDSSEYQWAGKLVSRTLAEEETPASANVVVVAENEVAAVPASANEVVASANEVVASANEVVASANEVVASANEVVAVVASANELVAVANKVAAAVAVEAAVAEVVAAAPSEIPEKKGWLYSLFGWA